MNIVMEKARALVDRIGDLPPMPAIIMEALQLLQDPSVSVKIIQDEIAKDQALTAFILKIANSPLYGVRSEVTTLSYAINLMGYNSTRSTLLAFLTRQCFASQGSKLIQNTLWRHALATAVFGKNIAHYLRKVNPEEVFIAALLHDIGKSVLFADKSQHFENVVANIFNDKMSSIDAEILVFGYTHVEVGYLIMKKWGFADSIIDSLVYHHTAEEYSGDNLLVPIISLANKLSYNQGFTFFPKQRELTELQRLALGENDLNAIQELSLPEIETYFEIVNT